jgi:hypothetical protein
MEGLYVREKLFVIFMWDVLGGGSVCVGRCVEGVFCEWGVCSFF